MGTTKKYATKVCFLFYFNARENFLQFFFSIWDCRHKTLYEILTKNRGTICDEIKNIHFKRLFVDFYLVTVVIGDLLVLKMKCDETEFLWADFRESSHLQ